MAAERASPGSRASSLASQLPRKLCTTIPLWCTPLLVGAGLLAMAAGRASQGSRASSLGSQLPRKLCTTIPLWCTPLLVGAGLLAMAAGRVSPGSKASSLASQLPRKLCTTIPLWCTPLLVGPACWRWRPRGRRQAQGPHRWQASSHGSCARRYPCGVRTDLWEPACWRWRPRGHRQVQGPWSLAGSNASSICRCNSSTLNGVLANNTRNTVGATIRLSNRSTLGSASSG